jgi:hypothetical protein
MISSQVLEVMGCQFSNIFLVQTDIVLSESLLHFEDLLVGHVVEIDLLLARKRLSIEIDVPQRRVLVSGA